VIQEKILDGVLKKSSIGFFPKAVDWDDEQELWRITDLELFETSLVPVPANPGTFVEIARRSLESIKSGDPRRWRALTGRLPAVVPDEEPAPEPRRVAVPTLDLSEVAKVLTGSLEWTERNQRLRTEMLATVAEAAAGNGG
jgi:hypothetical protein